MQSVLKNALKKIIPKAKNFNLTFRYISDDINILLKSILALAYK